MKKVIVLISILLTLCFMAPTIGMADNQQERAVPLDRDGYTNITSLKTGWNLASVFFIQEISIAELYVNYNNSIYTFDSAVTNHLLISTFFGWDAVNQQYEISDTLYGGKGYWIYSYVNCTLMTRKESLMEFDLKGSRDDGGNYLGVWGDGTYIYAACQAGGIRAYMFDGVNFILKGTGAVGVGYEAVWGDGTYIYIACEGEGIRAYTFDGTTFTLKGVKYDGDFYSDVWGDGTYIYAACFEDGIRAYTFDGTNFTLKGVKYNAGYYVGVWGDGTYIYAACFEYGIRAYTFDGTNFTLKAGGAGYHYDVWGDGTTYIYAACYGGGIRAYTFDGTTFTLSGTLNDGGDYVDVWGDGTYIYAACSSSGIRAYKLSDKPVAWITIPTLLRFQKTRI